MRVLVTGMGGQLGTRVAQLLEARSEIEAIVGYDRDPPRRRLARSEFHHIDPRDVDRVAAVVAATEPNVVVHLGVYEPHARLGPAAARLASLVGARALFDALGSQSGVERVVVRSGIEIYGRRRGGPLRPDESVAPLPTSEFGQTLLEVEQLAAAFGADHGVPVTQLRFAPVVGSHVPSPLGRLLKLRFVPVNALADPPFALLHADDAAALIDAAIQRNPDGPVNVVGSGATSAWQATRIGGRVPLPICGPAWLAAQLSTELLSAPLPAHVRELLVRGRVADGGRVEELLGLSPVRSTRDVVTELYDQSNVVFLPVARGAAA